MWGGVGVGVYVLEHKKINPNCTVLLQLGLSVLVDKWMIVCGTPCILRFHSIRNRTCI